MYLIYKAENPRIFIFDNLEQIEKSTEKTNYGKYNYNGKNNHYTSFTIIENPEFPYVLCDDHNDLDNIILDVSEQPDKKYYLLSEHEYAHGVWDKYL